MQGWSSGQDSCSRTTQAEARSTGRNVAAETPGRKPLSIDLDAFHRAAGSARVADASSSMGAHEDASAEHAASDRTWSRPATRQDPVEPTRPTHDGIVTVAAA